MRILLLSNLYPPYIRGGAEITARDITDGLIARGHEVTVLTSWFGLSKPCQEEHVWRTLDYADSIHFDRQLPLLRQFSQFVGYHRGFHCKTNAAELLRAVHVNRPDVLYIWEVTGIGIISILNVLGTLDIPVVFHLGNYWWQYIHSPQTEYSHIRLASLKKLLIGPVPPLTYTSLIAVSGAVKEKYIQSGCDGERIEIINSGIDPYFINVPRTERFVSKNSASDSSNPYATKQGIHLIYAGRVRVEKGILVILKALDLLVNEQGRREYHLSIFGEGDETYISELKTFLQEKQLTQAVTFHGKVPQDELIMYYDLSDMTLVPSLWQEPFGLVVAEAMARELPVIASKVGGPAEIITHGKDGLLVEPGDERALAAAIIELSENPEKRSNLVQAAQATVRERFMIQENIRRVEQHLLQVDHHVFAGSKQ